MIERISRRFGIQNYLRAAIGLIIFGCHETNSVQKEPDSAYGAGWSAVHADARNSDYSDKAGSRNVSLAWQKKFDGTINVGPTSDLNGHVYITTSAQGCHLYSLDAQTGETLWCTDEVNQYAVASSALLDNEGKIFIADDVYMYDFR